MAYSGRRTAASLELEPEGGRLIYSMDLTIAGRTGVEEVHVDALTGDYLAVKHETPDRERRERRARNP